MPNIPLIIWYSQLKMLCPAKKLIKIFQNCVGHLCKIKITIKIKIKKKIKINIEICQNCVGHPCNGNLVPKWFAAGSLPKVQLYWQKLPSVFFYSNFISCVYYEDGWSHWMHFFSFFGGGGFIFRTVVIKVLTNSTFAFCRNWQNCK